MNIDEQRQALREGLAITLHGQPNYWQDLSEYQQNHWRGKADTSLAFLTEQGAVLKVGTRIADLPYTEFNSLAEQCAFEQGLKDMLKADYTATAPLIEE